MNETKVLNQRAIKISYEDAHIEVSNLQDTTSVICGGVSVFSGKHPQYGNLHIVLTPLGHGLLLLPFESRSS